MASATYHKIVLRAANEDGSVTRLEALAGEAGIGPGDLLEHTTGGGVLRHNTASGPVTPVMVAVESPTNDDDDDFAIDVDYANGDTLYYVVPRRGDVMYMWLASGETSTLNDWLESNGDGALQVEAAVDQTDITNCLVGRAMDAVNAAAALSRQRVEIY